MLEELLKVLEPEQVIICAASEPGLEASAPFRRTHADRFGRSDDQGARVG